MQSQDLGDRLALACFPFANSSKQNLIQFLRPEFAFFEPAGNAVSSDLLHMKVYLLDAQRWHHFVDSLNCLPLPIARCVDSLKQNLVYLRVEDNPATFVLLACCCLV